MDFVGSQTEKNLLAAFADESQARTRYTFFASVALKEGYQQIGAISRKHQLTRKSTQNYSLNTSKAE